MLHDYIAGVPDYLVTLGITAFWVVALWQTLNIITPFDDNNELGSKNNVSYGVQRVALVAAQVIAMRATFGDYDKSDRLSSVGWMMAEGLWVFIAILVSRYAVDWIVLPKINNTELLRQNNGAIAAVEAGSYLGLGFMLAGSLTGGADSNALSIASTVVFYLLGLAFVLGVFWLHELVTPYNLREKLQQGSLVAGIETGSLIFATSVVVSIGVAGDFTGWAVGFEAFLLTAVMSVVLLYPTRLVLTKLGPGHSVREVQDSMLIASAAVTGGMMVLAGFAVSGAVSLVL